MNELTSRLDELQTVLGEVTFAWPFVLAGLLAVPLLLVVYAAHERRRRGRVAAFANPQLLPNMVRRRPGWRRHVAPLVLLVGLAALLVGAARPQRPVIEPTKQATVVLAIDSSRSMTATDVNPNRLEAAKAAARTLVGALPDDGRVGIVSFTRTARSLIAPTDDRTAIAAALDSLEVGGGTAVGDAIVQSLGLLGDVEPASDGDDPPAAIVVLSDGASTEGRVGPVAAATQAKEAGIPVYTVSLGTAGGVITDPATGAEVSVAPDPASLAEVAKAGGGKAYTAADAAELRKVYGTIGRQVGQKRVQQDLSVALVGVSTVLLLLAGTLSARWFGRLA